MRAHEILHNLDESSWKNKIGAAALAGATALSGPPAHGGSGSSLAGAAVRGFRNGMFAGDTEPALFKKKNEADLAFAERITDPADKAKYLKAVKEVMYSRKMSLTDTSFQGSNLVDEYRLKKLKKEMSEKYRDTSGQWEESVNEGMGDQDPRQQQIRDFIDWSHEILHLRKPYPKIMLSQDTEEASTNHHTGSNSPDENTIWVYIGNRNLIDIFRTIFHELVHTRQSQLGMLSPGCSYPGSPMEVMADALAGKYIKIYGEQHHEVFE